MVRLASDKSRVTPYATNVPASPAYAGDLESGGGGKPPTKPSSPLLELGGAGVGEKPCERKALEYKAKMHPPRLPLNANSDLLGHHFSTGIQAYFKVLKWLALLFLLIFIIQLPLQAAIVISPFRGPLLEAVGKKDGYQQYDSWRIASFGFGAIVEKPRAEGTTGREVDEEMLVYGTDNVLSKDNFLICLGVFDAVLCLILVAIRTRMVSSLKSSIAKNDLTTLDISDYSVLVLNAPQDASPAELAEYFEAVFHVQVAEVFSVPESVWRMGEFQKVGHLNLKLGRAMAKQSAAGRPSRSVAALTKKVQVSYGKLQAHTRRTSSGSELMSSKVFVSFETQDQMRSVVFISPRGWFERLRWPRAKRFRGRTALRVIRAGQPTDYRYENLVLGKVNLFLRRVGVWAVVFVLLLVSFIAMLAIKSYQRQMSEDVPWKTDKLFASLAAKHVGVDEGLTTQSLRDVAASAVCPAYLSATCVPPIQAVFPSDASGAPYVSLQLAYGNIVRTTPAAAADALSADYVGALQTCSGEQDVAGEFGKDFRVTGYACDDTAALGACYACYCYGVYQTLTDPNIEPEVAALWQHDMEAVTAHCGVFFESTSAVETAVPVLISFVGVGVNIILKQALKRLVPHEKHRTQTKDQKARTAKIFIAQYINSAVVPVLTYTWIPELQKRGVELPLGLLASGAQDIDSFWHSTAGTYIVTIAMFNVVVPRMADWAEFYFLPWATRLVSTPLTQEHLNELTIGPTMLLSSGLSEAMLATALALTFGTGLPILYGVAALTLGLLALAERHRLLRQSRQADAYQVDLPMLIVKLLVPLTLLHAVMGLWAVSYFESNDGGALGDRLLDANDDASSVLDDNAIDVSRVVQTHALPMLVMTVLLALGLVVQALVLGPLRGLVKGLGFGGGSLRALGIHAGASAMMPDPPLEQAKARGVLVGPPSYKFTDLAAYKGLEELGFGIESQFVGRGTTPAAQHVRAAGPRGQTGEPEPPQVSVPESMAGRSSIDGVPDMPYEDDEASQSTPVEPFTLPGEERGTTAGTRGRATTAGTREGEEPYGEEQLLMEQGGESAASLHAESDLDAMSGVSQKDSDDDAGTDTSDEEAAEKREKKKNDKKEHKKKSKKNKKKSKSHEDADEDAAEDEDDDDGVVNKKRDTKKHKSKNKSGKSKKHLDTSEDSDDAAADDDDKKKKSKSKKNKKKKKKKKVHEDDDEGGEGTSDADGDESKAKKKKSKKK